MPTHGARADTEVLGQRPTRGAAAAGDPLVRRTIVRRQGNLREVHNHGACSLVPKKNGPEKVVQVPAGG